MYTLEIKLVDDHFPLRPVSSDFPADKKVRSLVNLLVDELLPWFGDRFKIGHLVSPVGSSLYDVHRAVFENKVKLGDINYGTARGALGIELFTTLNLFENAGAKITVYKKADVALVKTA